MTAQLSDLRPGQILLLEYLDDEWDHADSFGQPMRSLSDAMLTTASSLFDLGLATATFGWQGAIWVRLSEVARRMIEEGLTE